jgi:hypothetical protein
MNDRAPGSERLPLSRGQRILRYIGGVILSTCAVMFVLGLTVLDDRLCGFQLITYWTWCFLLALASIVCALWDMILVRRAFKRTRRELFRAEFMDKKLANESAPQPKPRAPE